MRKMYSILLATLFVVAGLELAAQDKRFQWTFNGGLNLSNLSVSNTHIPGKHLKPGFNVGIGASHYLSKRFYLESGLGLSSKGAKISGDAPIGFYEMIMVSGTKATLNSNLLYVQLPLYAGYSIPLRKQTRLLFTAGPYIAYGIGGSTESTGEMLYGDMIENTPRTEKTFSSRGLKKWDYGMSAGTGIDLRDAVISLSYELGLRDIGPKDDYAYFPFYNNSYRNRNIALSFHIKI